MAQGDEVAGFFRRQNAGDLGGGEHVAFGHPACLQKREGFAFHGDVSAGPGFADGLVLLRDIHHLNLVCIINVR